MRRRRANDLDDGALDLFLDAISNVFGGILFIALAVVVLLQFTVPRDPADDTESDAVSVVVEASSATLPDALGAALSETSGDAADSKLVAQRERLRESLRALAAEVDQLHRRALEQAQASRDTATQAIEIEARRGELERQLLEAQRTLEQLNSRPTQRVRAARFRPTAKTEVPLMVSADRVVRPIKADGTLNRAALKLDEANQMARPAPDGGVAILQGAEGDAALTRLLSGLDTEREYLNVAVWPDGFGAARRLRDTAIDMGLDFTLTPVPAGSGVPFNAAAGVQ